MCIYVYHDFKNLTAASFFRSSSDAPRDARPISWENWAKLESPNMGIWPNISWTKSLFMTKIFIIRDRFSSYWYSHNHSHNNYNNAILTAQGCKKDRIHVLCIECNGRLEMLIRQENLLVTNILQLDEREIQFSFSSTHWYLAAVVYCLPWNEYT